MTDSQLARWVTDFSEQVLIPLKFIRKLLKQFIRNEAVNYSMQRGSIPDQSWDNFSFLYPFILHTLTNMESSVFLIFVNVTVQNNISLFNFHVRELNIFHVCQFSSMNFLFIDFVHFPVGWFVVFFLIGKNSLPIWGKLFKCVRMCVYMNMCVYFFLLFYLIR